MKISYICLFKSTNPYHIQNPLVVLCFHLVSAFLISFPSSQTMHILTPAKPDCKQFPEKASLFLSSTLWHSVTLSQTASSIRSQLEQLLPIPQDSAQWPYPRKPTRTSPDLSAPRALNSHHNYWVCIVALFLLVSPLGILSWAKATYFSVTLIPDTYLAFNKWRVNV